MSTHEPINPMWIAIGFSAFSMLVTAFVAYQAALRGTAVALARFEERQLFQGESLRRLTTEQDEQADMISEHDGRLRVLEHAIDRRGPPRDFVAG